MIVDLTLPSIDNQVLAQAVSRILSPAEMNKAVAEEGVEETRNHFRQLSMSRDRGSRFYEQYGDVTHGESSATEAVIVIPPVFSRPSARQKGNPLALRLWGGTVLPSGQTSEVTGRPIKHLSIPANAQARQMRTGDFENLVPVFNRNREVVALAMDEAETNVKRLGGARVRRLKVMFRQAKSFLGRVIMFWLVDKSVHQPDPTVIPSELDYVESTRRALEGLLA